MTRFETYPYKKKPKCEFCHYRVKIRIQFDNGSSTDVCLVHYHKIKNTVQSKIEAI